MFGQTLKALMTSIALGVITPPVMAQAPASGETSSPEDERIYLESDTLTQDKTQNLYIAEGNVYIESGLHRVRADRVEYNPETGRVRAIGHVEFYQANEPAQFADEIELNEDLSEGIARGFATLMENNAQAASAFALRHADGTTELSGAYYTACQLCENDHDHPTWRLRARRVIQDKNEEMIYYRDARLEIFGAPVLYTPVFAHPDPSATRKSGFLIPDFDHSKRLGAVLQVPYLWVISPNQDLVIAPRYIQELNPLIEFRHRKRFYSGSIRGEYSITHEQEFADAERLRESRSPFAPPADITGLYKYGEEETRWHAFVEGQFNLSRNWRWGFGLQETSGDLYLRRYDFDEEPQFETGLVKAENRRLVSQIYLTGRSETYYTSALIARYRSLVEKENDDSLPQMLPVLEAHTQIGLPHWMGDLNAQSAFANLIREDGDDYTRASLGLDWSRPTYLWGGIRMNPFLMGRLDAYKITDVDLNGAQDDQNMTRHLGAGGVDIRYPFIRPTQWGHVIISPRIQARISGGLDDKFPSILEDSTSLDLDRSTLFARQRAAGYDVWEDGAYLDYGVEASLTHYAWNTDVEIFAGRSYRMEGDATFSAASGLELSQSDYVTELSVNTGPFNVNARARIDEDSNDLNRLDLNTGLNVWRVSFNATYTRQADDDAPSGRRLEEIIGALNVKLTDNFSTGYRLTHDLDKDNTRKQQAHITYRDECSEFKVIWERENFQIGDLGPTSSIKFRFNLYTLGGFNGE
ncbi:LPS-assembly protein LptD [Woodsholea maritima]|uniref:LPS-assembly protein LptD n=1 Tax=Woodsholea maritima TaxID=240237 RepID=UPI0003646B98|nr:LPS assembly protein LptD [Woodsholea maritima]